jgi:hypothetical protein
LPPSGDWSAWAWHDERRKRQLIVQAVACRWIVDPPIEADLGPVAKHLGVVAVKIGRPQAAGGAIAAGGRSTYPLANSPVVATKRMGVFDCLS